ncbi:Mlc titration factor MtfA (ptsG expression regulator) [Algoriphagus sp. 4150]|uniref:zinc-dependent peptidase n=1 Tax=Algoriphagus sp. 4150 TaxID=2817756 RepID=UPI00285BA26F|nr:zinc-dependent peptidase [Algoriphagus sp. 4150]MDR7129046.1 Mlc titration factor MtfA (ptsG expression regulator) [Algoriphagus sp. 4150]
MMPLYRMNSLASLIMELRILFGRIRLTKLEIQILEQQFPYYARLSEKHKREFREKLAVILTTKSFMGRGGLRIVTSEMKILIGATMVMVTFGWKDLRLPHFSKILIYPDTYYSTISRQYHRGEVNPKHGIIVMSWNCFQEGLENVNDGVNLGIHEVAHALKLENQIHYNGESRFFNPGVYNSFQKLAAIEVENIKAGNLTVFRSSAGLNGDEFFAIALEAFFEKPQEFFDYNPALYGTLAGLMRQDPRVWIRK